jgi:membrane-bound metal-dependent hydrolase YbcI (DUF457 family)
MFITAHILAGLLIGKLTGHYALALASAVLIDVDHLGPYARHRVLWRPKSLWSAATDPEDPYKDQRTILHSFITWTLVSTIVLLIDQHIATVVSLGWLSHLILDVLDGSDFSPLYPFGTSVRGPIGYLSRGEFAFTALVLAVYLMI